MLMVIVINNDDINGDINDKNNNDKDNDSIGFKCHFIFFLMVAIIFHNSIDTHLN